MRGYKAAQQRFDEDSAGPFKRLKIDKDGEFAEVRILQAPDDWVSFYIHDKFKVLKSTRCLAPNDRDASVCPLCDADAPRKLRLFIPVRVRGDQDENRVQIIEYGSKAFQEVGSQLEELDNDNDILNYDFKIKRKGEKTDTTYKWIRLVKGEGPLTDAEKALEIPNVDALWPLADPAMMAERVKQFKQAAAAEPIRREEEDDAPVSRSARSNTSRF